MEIRSRAIKEIKNWLSKRLHRVYIKRRVLQIRISNEIFEG